MFDEVRTAVFPVAGLGTRLLPATKSVPKELLPVFDTPLIHFAIEEARSAGIKRLVFVSHPSKSAIEDYVRCNAPLAETLRAKGKEAEAIAAEGFASDPGLDIVFVMQPEPRGLGHAVSCSRDHVLPGPIAVLLPDDLILGPSCIGEMVKARRLHDSGHLVATMEVPPQDVSKYGMLVPAPRALAGERLVQAQGLVEKPAVGTAPSTLAVVGRYVLDACIFEDLAATAPGVGGEIQLTDAIARGIARVGLNGYRFSGSRHDCGTPEGLLAAANAYHAMRTMKGAARVYAAQ